MADHLEGTWITGRRRGHLVRIRQSEFSLLIEDVSGDHKLSSCFLQQNGNCVYVCGRGGLSLEFLLVTMVIRMSRTNM